MTGSSPPPRLRVVMFVTNDASHDTRVLREAASLGTAGHTVTVVARTHTESSLPPVEKREGFEIRRVPAVVDWLPGWRDELATIRRPWRALPRLLSDLQADVRQPPLGWLRAMTRTGGALLAAPWLAYRLADEKLLGSSAPAPRAGGTLDWAVRWQRATYGWARAAADAAPMGDVLHGHDLTGLPAAIAAADRSGGVVVYDCHEFFVESESHAHRPWIARRWLSSTERRLARRAAATVTVNGTLGRVLQRRLGVRRVVVVHNAPPRWTPPSPRPDLLRRALGIPSVNPVVLYHGGFTPDRGLMQLADAFERPGLEAAHLVYLGYGPLRDPLRARAAEARHGGRLHVLDAVPPDELPGWVASADVGVMPNQPTTENERLSTPNKLFECLAAGVPVVTADYPERRHIVIDDPDGPLGAVCDATDPGSIAAAIRSLLELPQDRMEALRARVLRAAHERWNWETESARLVGLYEELARERAGDTGTATASTGADPGIAESAGDSGAG